MNSTMRILAGLFPLLVITACNEQSNDMNPTAAGSGLRLFGMGAVRQPKTHSTVCQVRHKKIFMKGFQICNPCVYPAVIRHGAAL